MKVTVLMAMTLDGKIGRSPDHFPNCSWNCPGGREW